MGDIHPSAAAARASAPTLDPANIDAIRPPVSGSPAGVVPIAGQQSQIEGAVGAPVP
jgi:hypothetical protein